MRIVVTGVAGFVGVNFAEKALDMGAEVIGYDKADRFQRLEMAGLTKNRNFIFRNIDLETTFPSEEKPLTHIVHLAALAQVDFSMRNPEVTVRNNICTTISALGLARQFSAELIMASSVEVYGEGNHAYEDSRRNGMSPYALSKIMSEDILFNYERDYGLKSTVLRFTNLFGPWQSPDRVIPRAILRMKESLEVRVDIGRIRDFLHVSDAVQAIWDAVVKKPMKSVYNVSTGVGREIVDVVTKTKECMCSPSLLDFQTPSHDGRGRVLVASAGNIRLDTCWIPKMEFNDGLRSTIDWYCENDDWTSQFTSQIQEINRTRYLIDES